MALLSMNDVSLGFGGTLLLENINLGIEKGERVCLLGRNGEGKTTLLKLLKGDILADEGNVNIQKGVHIASLSQEVPKELGVNTYNVVAGGLAETGQL
ncbi:MAG: ABC-F family ATP-binding cassette domain-containing protein, partial [Desulfobacterales bacterium]|nr:ABC-F family ATP-binding cassette domain-containing protein [Desulfobacterales bacterium]